jgi:predicted nucleic acid-binding protein
VKSSVIVAGRGVLFAVIHERPLSAYDAEQVACAGRQGCSLVTNNRQLLDHYPNGSPPSRSFAPFCSLARRAET